MKLLLMVVLCSLVTFSYVSFSAQQYREPPSESTFSHVPVISDEKMEACVELYNEAEWIRDKLSSTHVDVYDEEAVDSYNAEVEKHSMMISTFNRDCAGKQSVSACKAAQKLNREKGLEVTPCS